MIESNRISRFFIRSVAILLFLTAFAKLYSAFGSARMLTARDPMMRIPYRDIMIVVGLIELIVAAYLFRGRDVVMKLLAILWLGSNFLIYRVTNEMLHFYLCPCLGTVMDSLYLSRKQSNLILGALVLYFFLGSAFLLLAMWYKALNKPDGTPIESAIGV